MSRFETKFAELAAKKEGAFVPFVTLCDPTFDRSFEIICTLVENGADALELGFPFSDPLLDGPVIQAANNRALNAGHSTEDSFKLLAKVRSKYPEIPISLLLCANLIFAKGLDNFYQRCAEAVSYTHLDVYKRQVLASFGGMYDENNNVTNYLKAILGFVGITDVQFVYAKGIGLGAEAIEKAQRSARNKIDEIIASL